MFDSLPRYRRKYYRQNRRYCRHRRHRHRRHRRRHHRHCHRHRHSYGRRRLCCLLRVRFAADTASDSATVVDVLRMRV